MGSLFDRRSAAGALIWVLLLSGLVWLFGRTIRHSPDAVTELLDYVGRQRRTVTLDSRYNLSLRIGDPVYLADSDRVSPVGMVSRVKLAKDSPLAAEIDVTMYGSSPAITSDDHFEFHYAPDSSQWLVRTMLTDDKMEQIRGLIRDAIEEHQVELVAAFRPLVERSLDEARALIEDDLKRAIAAREEKFRELGDRYRETLVKQKFLPLFQKELWPIIQRESEPLVGKVSREVWNEVSMFSFGWRYLYDRSPLPEKNLTEKKFRAFVDEKAMPIIESHFDDFLELQERLARQIVANARFKETVTESMTTIARDPEVQSLMIEVFREVLIDNQRLHEAIKEQWQSPQAKEALKIANSKLDPTIREIGVTMFGNPRRGITPEFAKVLRRRILHKDAQWLTLHLANATKNESLDRNAPFPETLSVRLSDENTNIPTALKQVEKIE